jgi:hypothetical protein
MDHLRVGGAEYAHINRAKDFNLVGADSLKLHKENVEQYRLSAAKKDPITKDLKSLEKELKSLADSRFPKALKEWLKTKEQFDAKKLDLFTYLGRTMPLLGRHEAEKELGLLSFILEAIRPNDPVVIEKAKHIDAREVFGELIKLEQAVAETYLHDAVDKQLFEYYKILGLLDRLNELQVSQEEYEAVQKGLKAYDTDSFARFIFSQAPKTLILSRMWERNIKDVIKFYKIAQERDHSLSQMLGQYSAADCKMALNPNVSVLVFGGFHKEAIKRILEAKGISYLVVSPRITKPSPRHEEFYKQLMTKGMYKFEVPINLRFASRALPVFAFANGGDEVRAIDNVIERGVEPAMVERYLLNTGGIPTVRSEIRTGKGTRRMKPISPVKAAKAAAVVKAQQSRRHFLWMTGLTVAGLAAGVTAWILENDNKVFAQYEEGKFHIIFSPHGNSADFNVIRPELDRWAKKSKPDPDRHNAPNLMVIGEGGFPVEVFLPYLPAEIQAQYMQEGQSAVLKEENKPQVDEGRKDSICKAHGRTDQVDPHGLQGFCN